MKLISILIKNKGKQFTLLTVGCILTGMLHVLLLMVINNSLSDLVETDTTNLNNMIVAFALLLGYLLLNRLSSGFVIRYSLEIINTMRVEIMRTTLKKSYPYVQKNGDRLYSAITKDAVTLSHAAITLTQLITSIIIVVGCLVYMAYLSFSMLFGLLIISLIGILIYVLTSKKNGKFLDEARESEDTLFFHVKQIINGFKEIKMNQKKGSEILDDSLVDASNQHVDKSYKGYIGFYNSSISAQFLLYSGLIILAFAGKEIFNIPTSLLISGVVILLYIVGPLESIATLIPQLVEGNVAACRLDDFALNSTFDDDDTDFVEESNESELKSISLKSLQFKYPSGPKEQPFVLDNLNIDIEQNKITFIYGGNGAGKTTLLSLVCGLLKPEGGEILFNSEVHERVPRNLISPVFNDFHLFDKLYGIQDIDYELANYYLQLFELSEKVTLTKKQFSTIELSTGQRKRLALISALLEKRSIIVLDEWAADQDPVFREKFYQVILPLLKDKGFTIVAITHDDKFYSAADSLYYMDKGKVEKKW